MPFSDCFMPRAIKDRKRADKKLWWKREMAVQHSIFCQFTFFHKLIRESYCYRDFSMSDVCYWEQSCCHWIFRIWHQIFHQFGKNNWHSWFCRKFWSCFGSSYKKSVWKSRESSKISIHDITLEPSTIFSDEKAILKGFPENLNTSIFKPFGKRESLETQCKYLLIILQILIFALMLRRIFLTWGRKSSKKSPASGMDVGIKSSTLFVRIFRRISVVEFILSNDNKCCLICFLALVSIGSVIYGSNEWKEIKAEQH